MAGGGAAKAKAFGSFALMRWATRSSGARGGERIALLGGGHMPASGKGALNTVLSGLALDTPLYGINQAVPRHATLILLSDFLDPVDEIASALERIATSGVAVEMIQVLDPSEIALSFSGR